MSRSKFWSGSQPTGRIALATAAVATIAMIAACSDASGPDTIVGSAAPLSVSADVGPSIANAKLATVCVSSTSPNGTYTFVNTAYANAEGGTTVLNSPVGTPYTLIKSASDPNPCVNVLTRTDPSDEFNDFSAVTVMATAPSGISYSSTYCLDDPGVQASVPCGNPSTLHANFYHGSRATFSFSCSEACIGTPQFVVGDLASGLRQVAELRGKKNSGNTLNFWGSQWWKNNPMSGYTDKGWPSFKGYATTADNYCGGEWTSRVGNSPPPPATIDDDVIVIVTSNVWKDGPDIRGNIEQIIVVHQDGSYGPNPGHDGNGPRIETLCSLAGR